MTKRNQKKLAKFLVAIILSLVGLYLQAGEPKSDQAVQPGYYEVLSVADGDTITVDMEGKKERIRFIGVDTPEVAHNSGEVNQCYAQRAKAFVEAAIDGKRVKLVADEKGTNRDRYGRLLRYVYNYQNISIDEQLVSEGYGFAVDGFTYGRKEAYLGLMDQAEKSRKGLWGICSIDRSRGYPEVST
jgi:micrococcal nuclease